MFVSNSKLYRLEIPDNLTIEEAQDFVCSKWGVVATADEAGRGPIAGPVVAAVVLLAPQTELVGLGDSKKLTEKCREKLFPLIQERALAWAIGEASAEEIDQINILEATFLAVRRALMQISLPWGHLLMDGNLPVRQIPLERQHVVVKGDGRVQGIAAASVLAKVHRDRLMCQLAQSYPQYGFEKHKGYPSPSHIDAVRQYGWSPVHRKSFRVKGL